MLFLKHKQSNKEEKKARGKKSIGDKACGWTPRLVLEEATCTYPMIG